MSWLLLKLIKPIHSKSSIPVSTLVIVHSMVCLRAFFFFLLVTLYHDGDSDSDDMEYD
jgi:hypothetical protein